MKRSTDQKLRLRNFDARHGRIETGAVIKSWRRKRYLLPVERKRPVFARKPLQFPSRSPRSCAKTRIHCRHTFWANRTTMSKCVEEEKYPRQKVTIGPFFDRRADIIWNVLAREHLVNIGIRPSANSIKMKRVVRLETSVCFRITRLMNNQIKSPKRATSQKENAVAIVMSVSQLGCASQDALVSQGRKSRGSLMQKVLAPIQRVRFTKSTLRHASIREKKRPSLGKDVKVPRQRSPYALKLEDRSHEETDRQTAAMCPKQGLDLAKNIKTFPRRNGYSPAASTKGQTKECL